MIKIRSLTSPLLMRRGVGYLSKPHMAHMQVTPQCVPSNESAIKRIAYYKQSDWPKKVITAFIISLCIHDVRSHACDPSIGFPQISHTATYQ